MENKNLNNSLFYGNIVKIESSKELLYHLNNTFFFVDYIDSFKIKLISEKLENQVFYLNSDGGIDNIDKVMIIHQQEEGYCVINRLLPGKLIKINFSSEDAFIQGEIIKLENDMITVKTVDNERLYIDFEYCGLLEKYNIRSVDIIKNYESYQTGEYVIVEEEEYPGEIMEEGGPMYSIEQQINDYIEKTGVTAKNKRQVVTEIEKYKTLLEEYTDLQEGIKIKRLANNQILYSLFELNPKILNLYSSYLHKELYCNNAQVGDYEFDSDEIDFSEWQYSVIEKNYDSSMVLFSNESYKQNIHPMKMKLEDHHIKIKLQTNQNIALVNKVLDSENMPFFFSIGKTGKIDVLQYDMIGIDKGERVILNGLIFKTLPSLRKEMNTHKSSNLLSKSLQNFHVKYNEMPEIRMLTNNLIKEKQYFDEKLLTFYDFKKDKSYKEYIEDLDVGLKELCEQIFDRQEITIYQCLKKLCLFDIAKLNTKEHLFIQKLVRENVNIMKRKINEKRSQFIRASKNQNQYVYTPHESMYEIIKNSYLSKDMMNNSKSGFADYPIGELLKISTVDNMELLLFELRVMNKANNIDFDDDEVNEYIMNLKAKLNGTISGMNENQIDYSKYYKSSSDKMQDVNKIILKNVEKDSNNQNQMYDPIQYLYQKILTTTKFKGTINDFVHQTDTLLYIMYQDENKGEADLFAMEPDREIILDVLKEHVLEQQIRKHDKCYVEEEKTFYVYDGGKWVNTKDFNSSLTKKKLLQVKNSIDEFEDIKTKIVNDYSMKYIHQNEIKDDKDDISSETNRNRLKRKIRMIRYNKARTLLKYNKQKNDYEKMFENMNFDELKNYSPYTNILHIILGVEDLERKYTLIQRFISLFTIDHGDQQWFYCVKRNTKLLPKYLHKLSESYLLFNNYESVMKEICHTEGYLSENGDAWIHKESGYVIKMLNFDTNYGYDENGFKIKLDTIEGVDNMDIIGVGDDTCSSNISQQELHLKGQSKPNTKLHSFVKEMTTMIMNDLRIKFKNIDNQSLIISKMTEIFNIAKEDPKYNNLKLIGAFYVVLSMLLIYVQSKNITTEKTYSSCVLSFSGFPYQQDEESLEGIEYLACYLHKRVDPKEKKNEKKSIKQNKVPHALSVALNGFASLEKSQEDIKNDLIYYIKNFFLKNDFVQDMIEHRRNFENKNPNTTQISPPPPLFKPALIDIETKDADEESFTHPTSDYNDKNEKKKRELDLVNMKIEEHIKATIQKENPLLKTYFEEPFLVNFCCDDKNLSLGSLVKSSVNQVELAKLVQRSDKLSMEVTSSRHSGTIMSIPVINRSDDDINKTRLTFYENKVIHPFLLESLNLTKRHTDIPAHLMKVVEEHNIELPEDSFYDEMEQKQDLAGRIEILDKYGIEFSHSFMEKIVSEQHYHYYEKKTKESEKANTPTPPGTSILTDFNFEFIENIGDEKLIDKFDHECKVIHKKYTTFITANISKRNQRTMKTTMNNWKNGIYSEGKNNEQFELYIKQIYNINRHLISLIPGLLINKNGHKKKKVDFGRFDFARKHMDSLTEQYHKYRNVFDKLVDANDETLETLDNISKHKDILNLTIFNQNRSEYYAFMLYLFYKVINQYMELTESMDIVVNVNNGIIEMILEYLKKTSYSYEEMVTSHKQSKQSEKSIKTNALKAMKPQEREAEKYKMAAKLGDWSYGNQTRVFKYYKKFYEDDTSKATNVQDEAEKMYYQSITDENNDVYNESPFEDSLTNIITNEENQNISMIADEDGIVYDDQGRELDEYE
uniref:Uncharacterized protein n=1 Tax=viral metagenome TaxID=1070528 RepID=A0A6C0KZ04_9ZZZZ|tara:strand:- start:27876 stop:33176 length:5301 start_codon:yes stop_codon:yes gene_type:complete